MLNRLGWFGRWCAMSLCCVMFALGCLVLRLVVLPLIVVCTRDPLLQRRRARWVISLLFYRLIRVLRFMRVLTYRIEGAEKLGRPGQMVIANHPSLLDVVFVIAHIRDSNCVVKKSLWSNVLTRGPVTSAAYVSNDSSLDMLDAAALALRQGETLIVFPEGTRTEPGTIPAFHRGAAAIALRGASVVTPLFIRADPPALYKHQSWFRAAALQMHFDLRVGADIVPADYLVGRPPPRAARLLNDDLQKQFSKELGFDDTAGT